MQKNKILCIGDKGSWPGNDYELLSLPNSLSVDEVSKEYDRCWNISSDLHGENAIKYYLDNIDIIKNEFCVKFERSYKN